ncbi:tyrosine-type recombinase/integrase [Terrisporobacter sp.]|uniref:tyrosine-type recombinase/integrase n=1 Tax=Terrisporobacter sp. TaxID=1965305 RepID=UPI002635CCA1|nr:tyrosine-type recombinase/integrase [Terrisporobacter sp.]
MNGNVIDDIYNYLNFECKYNSINSREQTLTFLKLLYTFKEIIGKPFELFTRKDIQLFSSFIQGQSIEGNYITLQLTTKRANSTHDQYFNIMRSYFKFLGIMNEALFEKKAVSTVKDGYGMMAHAQKKVVTKYTTNKSRHSSFTVLAPKHIKLSEYHKIIDFIENQDKSKLLKLRNRIIIELMYGSGLRIGEVLGLTLEDLVIHPDNKDFYKVFIRNRLTDKEYQKAKTCYKVSHKDDYTSPEYNKKDTGYQTITVTKHVKDMIDRYIRLSTNIMKVSDVVLNNRENFATSDCVTKERKTPNKYLFLNKNGTPLSTSGWNKELKFIFKSVGISCDSGKKRQNLNHRFRHGFAMLLIQNGYPIDEVRSRLRHANITSTVIYTKPTEDDTLKNTIEIDKLRFKNTSMSSTQRLEGITRLMTR